MKKKYKMQKNKRDYTINSIKDKVLHISTQLLVGKVLRKCHEDEVPAPLVALVEQCMKEVQFNWAEFLYEEFLANCKEAQEQGKTLHYAWLLLCILFMTWELPEDIQFPNIEYDLLEAAEYVSH